MKSNKDNLIKTIKQISQKNMGYLFRPDNRLLTRWHEASDKGRLEFIIAAAAGLIAGIFMFFMLLR